MTVYRATVDNLDMLVEMAQKEHAMSRFHDQPFDAKRVAMNFHTVISGMTGVVFITRGGFIVGMVQPCLFNRYLTAYELAWYAEDGSGIELLRELIKWSKAMKVVELVLHNYAGYVPDERFTRVSKRIGFEKLGAAYALNLT
jgi:hypothetical protein